MPEAVASRLQFVVRPADPDDVQFVVGTWIEGYRHGSPWAHRLTDAVFFQHHQPVIASILERAFVIVACDAADPRVIYGDVVYEPITPEGPALHWVYVKKAFRRLGVARALLASTGLPFDLAGVNVTHPTYVWFATRRLRDGSVTTPGRAGLEEMFPRAIHNPYLGLGLHAYDVPTNALAETDDDR